MFRKLNYDYSKSRNNVLEANIKLWIKRVVTTAFWKVTEVEGREGKIRMFNQGIKKRMF